MLQLLCDRLRPARSLCERAPCSLRSQSCKHLSQLAEANSNVSRLQATVTAQEEQANKDHVAMSALRKSTANAERRAIECETEMQALLTRTQAAEKELSEVRVCINPSFTQSFTLK